MGFIYGIKYKYSRKSAENLFPYILAQAQVCNIGFARSIEPGAVRGLVKSTAWRSLRSSLSRWAWSLWPKP